MWMRGVAAKAERFGLLFFIASAWMCLTIGGLPLIGVTVHLGFGIAVLSMAFILFIWGLSIFSKVLERPLSKRALIFTTAALGIPYFGFIARQAVSQYRKDHQPRSFVFVSPATWFPEKKQWAFIVTHRGSGNTFHIRVMFNDMDRSARYGGALYTPEQIRECTAIVDFEEIDSVGLIGAFSMFPWTPLDPERQHYFLNISYRGGLVIEDLQIHRINGRWAYRMNAGEVASSPTTLIDCRDPDFPAQVWEKKKMQPCYPKIIGSR